MCLYPLSTPASAHAAPAAVSTLAAHPSLASYAYVNMKTFFFGGQRGRRNEGPGGTTEKGTQKDEAQGLRGAWASGCVGAG